jgi:hypothetical protein
MPLITCPDCHNQVSDAAPACPKCGRPAQSVSTVGPATSPAEERVLFEDQTVKVTNVRAIIQQKTTYAMANVTSVKEFVEPKPAGVALLGLCLIALGLTCVEIKVADSADVGWVGTGLGTLLLVFFFFTKPKYWVRIGTAGAEANAVWSHNADWTRKVVGAINSAIVTRG